MAQPPIDQSPDQSGLGAASSTASERFSEAFGLSFEDALDISQWSEGPDLESLYDKRSQNLEQATSREIGMRSTIREQYLEPLADERGSAMPPLCGLHRLTVEDIRKIHEGTLLAGRVQAVDGTVHVHDTNVLTVYGIGVCAVSYDGQVGSVQTRLYRNDLRAVPEDPLEAVEELLGRRVSRGGSGLDTGENLAELARRGIMSYAERAVLAHRTTSPWRMGHGALAPYELVTGAGKMLGLGLLDMAADVIEEIVEHGRFVFVPSAPNRAMTTVGRHLDPLEFAVFRYYGNQIRPMIENGHLRGADRERADELLENIGREVAVVLFRTTSQAPPQVAYVPAEPERCAQAVAIAMADSALQAHRGFPLLIDIADRMCSAGFGPASFYGAIRSAYADVGHPYDFMPERQTRK